MPVRRLLLTTARAAVSVTVLAVVTGGSAGAQQLNDIFYIDMENHNLIQPSNAPPGTPQQLFGNAAAPFLNSLITPGNPNAAQTSWAGNYLNVAPGVHPSEPNYVWQEAGLHGPLNDADPYANTPNN
ncbi:MAG: hypothetical protein JO134_07835, partial [Xanthobacteraceae bacterium]|nr:hypothetical protein [Xanthobacteraceae bacterium]